MTSIGNKDMTVLILELCIVLIHIIYYIYNNTRNLCNND